MNANEYINRMADLIRTTGADVRIEDIDGKKRIAAKFPSVDAMRSEMKKAFTANMESATQGYVPLVLERAIEYRMDFGF